MPPAGIPLPAREGGAGPAPALVAAIAASASALRLPAAPLPAAARAAAYCDCAQPGMAQRAGQIWVCCQESAALALPARWSSPSPRLPACQPARPQPKAVRAPGVTAALPPPPHLLRRVIVRLVRLRLILQQPAEVHPLLQVPVVQLAGCGSGQEAGAMVRRAPGELVWEGGAASGSAGAGRRCTTSSCSQERGLEESAFRARGESTAAPLLAPVYLRLSVEFQWFLTALSVRPGSSLAMTGAQQGERGRRKR